MEARKMLPRKDGRIILHFDYDCFYAAVFEAANPVLKSLPLAVKQKQIIVTCNYEARRRGLHKLQLIKDARRICPDVIVEMGEDLSKFRDVSKELYRFIKAYSWSGKVERLGFDEVWLDVTDMIEYNVGLVNHHDLEHTFFQISREDPTDGFTFNAVTVAGHTYPEDYCFDPSTDVDDLTLRLRLGSHLAMYIRHQLEEQKGYTSTVGIATSKLLSKLAGNLNKPKGQTAFMPPLDGPESNVNTFMDGLEIGRIPGIGFRLAQRLRELILQRPAAYDEGLVYGGTKENITVGEVRRNPRVAPESLEKLFSGPGFSHGIGDRIWCLLHGVDDTEVSQAKTIPSQISIEDSYIRLDTMPEVLRELEMLARSLLTRMRIDLLGNEEDNVDESKESEHRTPTHPATPNLTPQKWLAHPKTLRLSTRPRLPLQPDGTRIRSFKRISHSGPLPSFVFNLHEAVPAQAERLVRETLVTMFRKLHPEKSGWNLSLANLAVTNMAETAGDSKTASGRDIGNMFKRQEDVLKNFRVVEEEEHLSPAEEGGGDVLDSAVEMNASETGYDAGRLSVRKEADDVEEEDGWDEDEDMEEEDELCGFCGLRMPSFAMVAHRRFHEPVIE